MPPSFGQRLVAIAALLAGGLAAIPVVLAEPGAESPTGSIDRAGQERAGQEGAGQERAGREPGTAGRPQRTGEPDRAPHTGRSPPDPDQDLAREAMSRGLVVPLDRVLRKAADFVPGDMLDVRLRSTREGSWIYEIRMLSSDGRIRVVVIDATRNDVIEVRRP